MSVGITKNEDRSQMYRKTVSWEMKDSVTKAQQEGASLMGAWSDARGSQDCPKSLRSLRENGGEIVWQ